MSDPTPEPASTPDVADRMKPLGQEAPSAAGRVLGLILLAVGVWFLADVTLGYSLPTIPWRDLWPVLLVVIGLFIIARGMTRRA